MPARLQTAARPATPHLIVDGDCRFCLFWAKRWKEASGGQLTTLASQDLAVGEQFPEIPGEWFEKSVVLVEPDGSVFSGAEAALRSLAYAPSKRWLLRWYERSPGFAAVAEAGYRFVARHRPVFSWFTRVGWGSHSELPTHFRVRDWFLRALGGIYLVAFVSLWVQIDALVGSKGIVPAGAWLEMERGRLAGQSWWVHAQVAPTICWWNSSDGFLHGLCIAGTAFAFLLMLGIARAPVLFGLWLLYLSLAVAGQDFLSFQWDTLLLEAGFLAMFCAPRTWWLPNAGRSPPSLLSIWLLRWLLFRLMFQSGLTKLVSGEATWSDWTALTFHYETQPLPTWIGWWVHQLPAWTHRLSCGAMFAIELVVPFLFFGPPRLRLLAATATVLLQVLIALTGNYTFFNLLTIVLCIPLLDDGWIGGRPRGNAVAAEKRPPPAIDAMRRWTRGVLAAFVIVITSVHMTYNCRLPVPWPDWAVSLTEATMPFRTLNSYGLFRVMTRPRYELVVEGSNDASDWKAYEFRYKPGDPGRRPGFVAPHQPRLDWQMWFEALRPAGTQPSGWFVRFLGELLSGNPAVAGLMAANPFPGAPPRYLRVMKYEYRFSTVTGRRESGQWWQRKLVGLYVPTVQRKERPAGGEE